jgi:putative flavoprotein involved in K+ transport
VSSVTDVERRAPDPIAGHYPVVVVGGGQAGLAVSWCLGRRDVHHVVFERDRIGHEWADARWDTFCLVTPNWQCQLPGYPYPGSDPHGFMVREEIVDYIRDYAASFDAPVREGVEVTALRRGPGGSFDLATSIGDISADQVVVATGAYQVPVVPRLAERLPETVAQLHSSRYRGVSHLPPGAVLVVGSGQSGAQIAEDAHLAGRRVHLAVGGAPRVARFYRGRDVVAWLHDMGYYDMPIHRHPLREDVRKNANHYVTGRDGGHDIDLRLFATQGMNLYGRLAGAEGDRLRFTDDLAASLDRADAVSESIKDTIDAHIAARGISAPVEDRYVPVWHPPADAPRELDLVEAGVSSVVWAVGYRADYAWIDVPVFNGQGYPTHTRGVTSAPGLFFLGLPWLHTWGSGRFSGIGHDAEHLARIIASRAGGDLAGAGARGLNALALGS